ncbi:hypothetical protein PBT90_16725 [Algoriphagus halophytocola]|uniref:hypothetical protein n=1 Tax=Algoriphagus halophytocola TaxID=2991499 RepID=UPI0022DD8E33|nr:hypothetical protein [Algoriphagus sp. TR-M9]WBL42382.1 hypothetical protein PBT90_16725 [Algoriphagus sp. TR-M9]
MTPTKKGTTVKPITEAQKNEVESLKKQIEELQNQLKSQPESLEDKIKYFQAKQENITKLNRLDGFAELLIKIGEDVKESMKENDFSSEKFAVTVTKKDYSHSQPNRILDINNPVLVSEVLAFALDKINVKRTHLQTLIEA